MWRFERPTYVPESVPFTPLTTLYITPLENNVLINFTKSTADLFFEMQINKTGCREVKVNISEKVKIKRYHLRQIKYSN